MPRCTQPGSAACSSCWATSIQPHCLEGNFHHLGATRMHADPSKGVVDADCRVHGIRNLYVAGSSVFPTYGCSNPTLTVVALALRLADHLRKELAHARTP